MSSGEGCVTVRVWIGIPSLLGSRVSLIAVVSTFLYSLLSILFGGIVFVENAPNKCVVDFNKLPLSD